MRTERAICLSVRIAFFVQIFFTTKKCACFGKDYDSLESSGTLAASWDNYGDTVPRCGRGWRAHYRGRGGMGKRGAVRLGQFAMIVTVVCVLAACGEIVVATPTNLPPTPTSAPLTATTVPTLVPTLPAQLPTATNLPPTITQTSTATRVPAVVATAMPTRTLQPTVAPTSAPSMMDSGKTAPVSRNACPNSHPVKGNLTTYNGERIYHVPGGQFYNATNPEACFATERDAQAAGYRRSLR